MENDKRTEKNTINARARAGNRYCKKESNTQSSSRGVFGSTSAL